jgi:hypothetical protein
MHGIINGVAQSAAVTLRCIGNITHNLGQAIIGPDSGAPYDETKFIGEMRPEIATTVMALSTLFNTVSALGTNCFTADGSHPGIRAFLQSHNPCAANARTAGSNHRQITVAKAQLLVTQFGGSRGQSAPATIRVVELSTDGVARPDVIVQNAALPGTFIADEEFCITAPRVANFPLDADAVASWQIDTGIKLTAIVPAGSIFPTVVDITKVRPRWTIVHDDPTFLSDAKIPHEGIVCTHANTFAFLQKRSPMGGLVAAASTVHIKASMAGHARIDKHYDASGSATGQSEIQIESTEGVGGVPLTITTGVAIA